MNGLTSGLTNRYLGYVMIKFIMQFYPNVIIIIISNFTENIGCREISFISTKRTSFYTSCTLLSPISVVDRYIWPSNNDDNFLDEFLCQRANGALRIRDWQRLDNTVFSLTRLTLLFVCF